MERIAVALLFACLLGTGAEAGTSLAGPLVATQHRCCVLNVGSRPAQVTARIFDELGTDVTGTDLCALNAPIQPRNSCCAQASQDVPVAAHCVIQTDRPKREIRGSLAAEQAAGEPSAVLEAR